MVPFLIRTLVAREMLAEKAVATRTATRVGAAKVGKRAALAVTTAPKVAARRSGQPIPTLQRVSPGPRATPVKALAPDHGGNAHPLDGTFFDFNSVGRDRTDMPLPDPSVGGKQSNIWADKAATLSLAASNLQQLSSTFLPGMTWTGGVTARGFKDTPLQTVLHYCLAVVFGLTKQPRAGKTILKADVFPIENRVEVSYSSTSQFLLEPINVAVAATGGTGIYSLSPVLDLPLAGARFIGKQVVGPPGGGKFVNNGNADPKAALDAIGGAADNINRRIGPAGIWDMAQSDIKAGKPPLTMDIKGIEPYTSMFKWSADGHPMLTRDTTSNPEIKGIPGMHWPTHYDLRSLVAQAFYDPGVLPPLPDTVVALPQRELP